MSTQRTIIKRWPLHVRDRHAGKITIYGWSTRSDPTPVGATAAGSVVMPSLRSATFNHRDGQDCEIPDKTLKLDALRSPEVARICTTFRAESSTNELADHLLPSKTYHPAGEFDSAHQARAKA
jgi:hypothetical protein